MLDSLRRRMTFANVVALIALFFAIGGPAMADDMARSAARLITGQQIRDGSIQAKDLSRRARARLRGRTGPQGAPGERGPIGLTGPPGSDAPAQSKAPDAEQLDGTDSSGFAQLNPPGRQSGSLSLTGALRLGSESGSAAPSYPSGSTGLVIRRIVSSVTTDGTDVARTDEVVLERNGTNSGWEITNSAGAQRHYRCSAMESDGSALPNKAATVNAGATVTIYTGSTEVPSLIRCSFGHLDVAGHFTDVVMARSHTGGTWVGVLTSTFNQ